MASTSRSYIDLRSDTVTKPTREMRQAMLEADVGDDVYGEDPTVNRLQEIAAEALGKEAAIFVTSGTMGNLAAILAHCMERGSEVIVGDQSHTYVYEAGGASVLGGVAYNVVPTQPNGEIALEDLENAVRPIDQHAARTVALCLENTHNRCGGRVLSLDYMQRVHDWAQSKGIVVHLDGARVFNAATALGVDVKEITSKVTSVQLCLSKGLGSPVGSIVAGPRPFIDRVHRFRKMLGGGTRQMGVCAAPGLISLTKMSKRLAEDHYAALLLAGVLSASMYISLDVDCIETNIIVFTLTEDAPCTVPELLTELKESHGVLMIPFRAGIRAVTHFDVSYEQCTQAGQAVVSVLDRMADDGVHVGMANGGAGLSPYG